MNSESEMPQEVDTKPVDEKSDFHAWQAAKRIGSIEAYQEYLKKYTKFAAHAKKEIQADKNANTLYAKEAKSMFRYFDRKAPSQISKQA
ncbi:MAG: hypothetical protein KAH77_06090 [Thiomargarita sp.]|nr:hypothetical protein [Thiomargarita sp.]